jgi:hypothetical protein
LDRLTDTMQDLAVLLGPIAEAERGTHRVEGFFGRRDRKEQQNPEGHQPKS